jgi:hypothetical protein
MMTTSTSSSASTPKARSSRWTSWRRGLGYFLDGPAEEPFDGERLSARFARDCGAVPQQISGFVLRALKEYGQLDPPNRPRREKFRRERWQQLTDFGAR